MVLRVAAAAVWAEAVDLSSDVVLMPALSTQQNIAWWWIDFFHHKITAVGLNRWLLLPFTRRILFSSTLIRFMMLWGGFMDHSLWGAILQWNIKSKNLQQNTRPNLKGKKQPLTAKQLLSRSYPARKRSQKTDCFCVMTAGNISQSQFTESHTARMVMVRYKYWPIYFQKCSLPDTLNHVFATKQGVHQCCNQIQQSDVQVLVSFWFYIGVS